VVTAKPRPLRLFRCSRPVCGSSRSARPRSTPQFAHWSDTWDLLQFQATAPRPLLPPCEHPPTSGQLCWCAMHSRTILCGTAPEGCEIYQSGKQGSLRLSFLPSAKFLSPESLTKCFREQIVINFGGRIRWLFGSSVEIIARFRETALGICALRQAAYLPTLGRCDTDAISLDRAQFLVALFRDRDDARTIRRPKLSRIPHKPPKILARRTFPTVVLARGV
jgi:hypothetical protein